MRIIAFVESAVHGAKRNYAMLDRFMLMSRLQDFSLPEWRIEETPQGGYCKRSEEFKASPLLCCIEL
jgi:hypothetical protein